MPITMSGTGGIATPTIQTGGVATNLYPLVSGTTVATTSGTTVVIATDIPSWVNRITLMVSGVSLSGTSQPIVQFGTGSPATYVTTGYLSASDNYSTTAGPVASSTAGFRIGSSSNAGTSWYGTYVFATLNGLIWVGSLSGASSGSVLTGGGGVTLAAPLTALRFNTVNGTDLFDAGSVNILYE